MNKKLSGILFLFVFLLEVAHDAIPHHHPELQSIRSFVYNYHASGINISEPVEHEHSFLPHQHYFMVEDFIATRIGNPSHSDFSKLISDLVLPFPFVSQGLHKPPGITNLHESPIFHQSYPFILSPNAMRGSPLLA